VRACGGLSAFTKSFFFLFFIFPPYSKTTRNCFFLLLPDFIFPP
jgi:hypothetical protein